MSATEGVLSSRPNCVLAKSCESRFSFLSWQWTAYKKYFVFCMLLLLSVCPRDNWKRCRRIFKFRRWNFCRARGGASWLCLIQITMPLQEFLTEFFYRCGIWTPVNLGCNFSGKIECWKLSGIFPEFFRKNSGNFRCLKRSRNRNYN